MAKRSAGENHCGLHNFDEQSVDKLRSALLQWYDENQRDLPWRTIAKEERDADIRAYAVWVSEIMLQQTQVATVIDYYKKWMQKWPTVQHLAKASLEEVNEVWSGLGYYSRARRLREGAIKVQEELGGHVPSSSAHLIKQLPGVGQYTAGAISSIAFNEVTGVVDGNVVRVLSRLRAIGAESSSQLSMEKFWELANSIVDQKRPGDFNQAMMEFGATVCTKKLPNCARCPLQMLCNAHHQVEERKKEAKRGFFRRAETAAADSGKYRHCNLCLPQDKWDVSAGVTNFPCKEKRKPPVEEQFVVGVVWTPSQSGSDCFLLCQRPSDGLLAGMWEFPMVKVDCQTSQACRQKELSAMLEQRFTVKVNKSRWRSAGQVAHTFSHRQHVYHVEEACLRCSSLSTGEGNTVDCPVFKWVPQEKIVGLAISTGVRKILKLVSGRAPTDLSSSALSSRMGKRKTSPSAGRAAKRTCRI